MMNETLKLWKSFPLHQSSNLSLLEEQILLNESEWNAAAHFIMQSDFQSLPSGKKELTTKGTYISVSEYTTRQQGDFETHRNYVDVQILVSGNEIIYVAPAELLGVETVAYNEQKDIAFFAEPQQSIAIQMKPGVYALFFPSDGHKPSMSVSHNQDESVKKIVIKIPFVKKH